MTMRDINITVTPDNLSKEIEYEEPFFPPRRIYLRKVALTIAAIPANAQQARQCPEWTCRVGPMAGRFPLHTLATPTGTLCPTWSHRSANQDVAYWPSMA
jgi:hypothetical protein